MTLTVLRRSDHADMPWLNGGGRTLEVARSPREGDFDWRVSFALVEGSGPFSAYPGVDRVITLVEGGSMRVTVRPYAGPCSGSDVAPDAGAQTLPDAVRATVHELLPHEPYSFAGEDEVGCEVTTPTTDLNLMTRRSRCQGAVTTHRVGGAPYVVEPGAHGVVLVAVLAGTVVAQGEDADGVALAALDVLTDLRGPVTLTGDGVVAVLRVDPVTS